MISCLDCDWYFYEDCKLKVLDGCDLLAVYFSEEECLAEKALECDFYKEKDRGEECTAT